MTRRREAKRRRPGAPRMKAGDMPIAGGPEEPNECDREGITRADRPRRTAEGSALIGLSDATARQEHVRPGY